MISSFPDDRVKAYFSKYRLHEDYGFYHNIYEDEQLPLEFKELEELALKVPVLNASKTIRKAVKGLNLPPYDSALQSLSYNQSIKLFALVCFLTNSYLFNEEPSIDILPTPLSTILYSVTKRLGIRPIMSYICNTFWNTQIIDAGAPVELDNLKLRNTFTGNIGEEWFQLVSIANDIVGMRVLKNLIGAQEEIEKDNPAKVAEYLNKTLPDLELMITSLKRMHEKLDPDFFYHHLRKYLAGYQKFSKGLRFEGVTEFEEEGPKFSGMSAGQSPFYQTFQNALGLKYGDERIEQMEEEIREGMTRINREMVADAAKYFTIRDYASKSEGPVRDAYNKIIDAYIRFKQSHWGLIARYIIGSAKKLNIDPKILTGVGGTPISSLIAMGDLLAKNKL